MPVCVVDTHVAVHEDGYRVEREPDGSLMFRRPDGTILPDVPPAPVVSGDPMRTIREANAAVGLEIGPRTSLPTWLGERLDVGWALDVLHPLAVSASAGADSS